jgi:hypothetical protein
MTKWSGLLAKYDACTHWQILFYPSPKRKRKKQKQKLTMNCQMADELQLVFQ